MRTAFLLGLALSLSSLATIAHAQDPAASARTVAQCLREHDEQVQRLMRLLEQAETRAHEPGIADDVRRDAAASVTALVDRIRAHAQQVRHCIERNPIPVHVDGTVTETTADPAHDSLAADRGTVHQIESGTQLAPSVRAVRGERVDGSGQAPDENVRAAMRGIGSRLAACYGQYLDRAAHRAGEVTLTFTASDGGRVGSAQLEGAGGFDTTMRQCVERAAVEMVVRGQRGRAVYSYVVRFGD
ncbi:hypothetical protein [Sandaracinus amylolyticus]|uniref:AgmX/PglI C-terminal domain-containing protein n=1 Tax=Sandaracinus amylolyticus TaxID=927083 RepID=A0A0F6YLH6_9BACT|nr:hypothetical protein [Sandaracinus amylolyticus]AKF10391.1 hypothetical protein DB32_007540 [Sandaracinus amylolyticus]